MSFSLRQRFQTSSIPSVSARHGYVDGAAIDLTGTLPHEIDLLSSLNYLDLSQKHMAGISGTVFFSQNFRYLPHKLGAIPERVGRLVAVEHLILESNLITGTLPQQLNQLEALVSVCATETSFSIDVS